MAETIIHLDLNDPRSQDIAEVISNPTCKKILNLIAEKELTETDIASQLKVPLNTIDYNIKKLVKSGLIESTSHFWSIKGKKMPSYKISEKKIVISPKSMSSKIFYIPLLVAGGALAYIVREFTKPILTEEPLPALMAAKDAGLAETTSLAATTSLASTADLAPTTELVRAIPSPSFLQNLASQFTGFEWLLIGVWLGVILFIAVTTISERRNNKN